MHLFIDASNIRRGGGLIHLREVLGSGAFVRHGFKKITLWAPLTTIAGIQDHPALAKKAHGLIDAGRFQGEIFRLWILERELDKTGADILWVPGGNYRGKFRPYVCMLRNLLPFELRECDRYKYSAYWLRLKYLKISQKKSFHNASGVICLSNHSRKLLKNQIGMRDADSIVIPHGLDQFFFLPPRPQKLISDYSIENPYRIFYNSPINLYKHQDKLLIAVFRLIKMGYPLRLELAGMELPSARRKMNRIIHSMAVPYKWVRFHGEVTHARIKELTQSADMGVALSTCEAFGMFMLEAMAAGLPMICSGKSSLKELNDGIYPVVDPESVDAVSSALQRLIDSPSMREQVAKQGFYKARKFSWGETAENTFKYLCKFYNKKKNNDIKKYKK